VNGWIRNTASGRAGRLKSVRAKDWTGTITTLSSTNDGKGVLAVQLPGHVTVGTTNNGLSESLSSLKTLIPGRVTGADAGHGATHRGAGQSLRDLRPEMLDVVWNHCDRRGCLSSARLIERHGRGMTMPELLGVTDGGLRAAGKREPLPHMRGAFPATAGAV
jgi:hypothetical protein